MYLAISFTIDVLVVVLIACGIFRYSVSKVRAGVFGAIYALIACSLFVAEYCFEINLHTNVAYFGALVFSVLLLKKIGIVLLSYVINIFVGVVILTITRMAISGRLDVETMVNTGGYNLAMSIGALFIYGCVVLFVHRKGIQMHMKKFGVKNLILCIMALFSVALYAFSFQVVANGGNISAKLQQKSLIIIVLSMLFVVTLIAALIVVDSIRERTFVENQLSKDIINEQQRYYQLMEKKNEETQKLRHDMKNHIYCIARLNKEGQYRELDEYIEKLEISAEKISLPYDTGNSLMNSIVGKMLCDYEDVEFSCEGVFPKELNISSYDICTIFYNLLKNAFECEADRKEANKKVVMQIRIDENDVGVLIKNPVDKKVNIINGNIVSTKKGDYLRGYGIKNARETLEKNGGYLTLLSTREWFEAYALLYNVI